MTNKNFKFFVVQLQYSLQDCIVRIIGDDRRRWYSLTGSPPYFVRWRDIENGQ